MRLLFETILFNIFKPPHWILTILETGKKDGRRLVLLHYL